MPSGTMLPKDRPVLILMDEIISYVSTYRGKGYGGKLYNFLDCLGETARGERNVSVVVSVPASELEYTADDTADEARFKKMLDRVGKPIMMSADREMAEIIRRRLFDWGGMPDEGRRTAAAFAEWAVDNASELAGFNRDNALELFLSCYPFHPSVLSVFERKWQSLHRFQRTRGVLRMLALWVAHNYQDEHRKNTREPLITLGLAPLVDPTFRAAMFEQLGNDSLEVPVTTDIAGKADAHGTRLDKEADEAIRKAQLHRKVATTIFFESDGGMSQAHAEATLSEIKTGVGGPDVNSVDVDNVLEGMAGSCFYLNWERNRYRFGLSPNLNQILITRRGAVTPKAIEERVKKDTEAMFGKGTKELLRRPFPTKSTDIEDRPVFTLAYLSLDYPASDPATLTLVESIIRNSGSTGRTFKSALIFVAPDQSQKVLDAARNVIAWEDIDDDEETKQRIEGPQKDVLTRNLRNAKGDLRDALWRSYRHLYYLQKDNTVEHVDMPETNSSAAENIVALILGELYTRDILAKDGVGPTKIVKYWPPALVEWSTKGVRDAFYSSPQFYRLLNPDMVKRAICAGVSDGTIAYVTKNEAGNLKIVKMKETLIDTDVDISEDFFILKAADAEKLLDPPKLARLCIRPERVAIKVGEQASFAVSGVDQYGQSFAVGTVALTPAGGTISPEGLFTAGATGGQYNLRAEAEGVEAFAEVRIRTEAEHREEEEEKEKEREQESGQRFLRWRGRIPAQKWTKFYMNILTKFVSSPDLKIDVSFEVPVVGDQGQTKAEEARAGLKELGLDDSSLTT